MHHEEHLINPPDWKLHLATALALPYPKYTHLTGHWYIWHAKVSDF